MTRMRMAVAGGARVVGNPSPLDKIAVVDPSTLSQQGTSREVYHYVPMTQDRNYEFFVNLNNTNAMFKNLDQNKLTVGESIAINQINFLVAVVDATDPEIITGVSSWIAMGFENLMIGKVDIVIGNQTVIKDLPVHASRSEFSDDAKTNQVAYIKLKSPLVLKKDVEFKVVLKNCGKLPAPILNTFIGIGLQGYGKILKSRGTL